MEKTLCNIQNVLYRVTLYYKSRLKLKAVDDNLYRTQVHTLFVHICIYISGPGMSNNEIVKIPRKTADVIRTCKHFACCSIQFNIIKSISPLALKVSCLFILHVLLAISFSNHQCHSRPNRNNSIKT